jgi:hypothetical protein
MNRFRKYLPHFAAALVGVAILGAPTQARADFELRYSVNGGAFQTFTTSGGFLSETVDGLTIQATATGSSTSSLTKMDLSVSGASTGALTLVVQSWLSPAITVPAPQTATYAFTGSILPGGAGSISDQLWVNSSSVTAFGMAGDLAHVGPVSPSVMSSVGFSGASPYSITLGSTIVTTSSASISSDNNLSISSPAPPGLILLLSGSPIFGLAWRRRVKASKTQDI